MRRLLEEMNGVSMIEYQGRVDENGKALGHGPKVLNEYFDFIKEYCHVSVYAPVEILREFRGNKYADKVKVLPKRIVMGQDKTVFVKVMNKINMFRNISLALKHAEGDTVWFFNVEFYFFLYMLFCKKAEKRIVVTMFLDGYRGGVIAKIKQFVFERAQKKIDFIISTGQQLTFKNCSYQYIPDYYFAKDKYSKYSDVPKERLAVCLGTMGKGKQLKELVDTFTQKDYPLVIAGRFYDKELLEELKSMAGSNITIRDEYLSNEEYMSLLAKATFTVLPYSPDKYDRQTSGVMQEALFVNTIPVSYNAVLDGNSVPGIGFDNWNELSLSDIDSDRINELIAKYSYLQTNVYDVSVVKNSYREIFG